MLKNNMNTYIAFVLFLTPFLNVNTQDLTCTRTKHPTHLQPTSYDAYYSAGNQPNTKFKPGLSYKTIQPRYSPSDVCFNPYYYGFGMDQMSPVPQPNIYYFPNDRKPYWSSYTSRTLNNYPCVGGQGPANTISPSLMKPVNSNSPKRARHDTNDTDTEQKTITIRHAAISVKIIPPTFNENATAITNMAPPLNSNDKQSSAQDTRLDEKTRTMIKKLLESDSKSTGKFKEAEILNNGEESSINEAKDHRNIGTKANRYSDAEMFTLSRNEYPLPKTTYGNGNGKQPPSSSFERMKIFTEFNPPDD